jgi:aspartate kinase
MGLIVQKYGGTSVKDVKHIKNVAQRVANSRDKGNDVIVVLSAMAGVTDNLIKLADEASESPDEREMDTLLATGEQTTIALLSMILNSMGYPAKSLLGFQAGITTNSSFNRARIVNIDGQVIKNLLNDGNIVVIAGFQGWDDNRNITTLGRGGSDTSAVAIAASVNADACEIYTDVDGI